MKMDLHYAKTYQQAAYIENKLAMFWLGVALHWPDRREAKIAEMRWFRSQQMALGLYKSAKSALFNALNSSQPQEHDDEGIYNS